MSIASEISRLQGVKENIIRAIVEKGVQVPSGAMLGDLPSYIQSIGSNTIGGRAYRTVTIGGMTWLAENLDYKASGIDIGRSDLPTTPAAWYYNNDESTYGLLGNKYGLLYNWYAIKHLNDNRATLMPGWHVPSSAEWDALVDAVGGSGVAGTKLKATSGWNSGNGTDDFGFSIFPAGDRLMNGGFINVGIGAIFWTATEESSSSAYRRNLDSGAAVNYSSLDKTYAFSVRLVKDT